MQTEIWKDAHGYEGLYEVSNLGNVKSYDKQIWNRFKFVLRKGRLMKTYVDRYGYVRVCLYKDGKKTTEQVHRLVALTFIPNPDNLPQVNHKDANKQNNNVTNLEWCTCLQNMRHAFKNVVFDYQTIPVVKIDNETNIVVAVYESVQDAAKDVSDNPSNILRACNFDNDSSKGFRWRKNSKNYKVGDYVKLKALYHPSTKKRKVVKIKDGYVLDVYDSLMEAARQNDCENSAICMCCKGKINSHKGYQWKYYEDIK